MINSSICIYFLFHHRMPVHESHYEACFPSEVYLLLERSKLTFSLQNNALACVRHNDVPAPSRCFVPASNEPSSRARADIWRMPRGRCVPAAHVQHRPKRSADQIPRPLEPKEQARPCPVACCGVFDWLLPPTFYFHPRQGKPSPGTEEFEDD